MEKNIVDIVTKKIEKDIFLYNKNLPNKLEKIKKLPFFKLIEEDKKDEK